VERRVPRGGAERRVRRCEEESVERRVWRGECGEESVERRVERRVWRM
jgi:hypothetical protein